MTHSIEFLARLLDTITEHIVVIDSQGSIKYVNDSWCAFGSANACLIGRNWEGVNYLSECNKAAKMGDEFGMIAAKGIKEVISKTKQSFYFEYPCHSPEEKRWFIMRVTPFELSNDSYYVISHQNITKRKLAEEKLQFLAQMDGLTKIANRRTFDQFLHNEWLRCARLKKNICLAIIDIDHFKLLNDHYGHQAGDDCLKRVGKLLKKFTKRPGDICARYGGEEFALVWSDTSVEDAEKMAQKFLNKLTALQIPNQEAPTLKYVTASIGLAEAFPNKKNKEEELIKMADRNLYLAKEGGRNRVQSE